MDSNTNKFEKMWYDATSSLKSLVVLMQQIEILYNVKDFFIQTFCFQSSPCSAKYCFLWGPSYIQMERMWYDAAFNNGLVKFWWC